MEVRSSDVQESKPKPKADSGAGAFRECSSARGTGTQESGDTWTSRFPNVAHFSGLLEKETKVHHLSKSRKRNAHAGGVS